MDKVDKYVTLRDGDVVMRSTRKRRRPARVPMALAKQALGTLAARYEFTPRGPILIEIFPSRTTSPSARSGCRMVGALGVCFGRVSRWTRPTPGARRVPWEATLWHELAHVITCRCRISGSRAGSPRDFGLRGEEGAARVGARWTSPTPAC